MHSSLLPRRHRWLLCVLALLPFGTSAAGETASFVLHGFKEPVLESDLITVGTVLPPTEANLNGEGRSSEELMLATPASILASSAVHPGSGSAAISLQSPTRTVISPGEPFALRTSTTGSGMLHYQWFRNGRPLPGANSSDYVVPAATYQDSGWYFLKITDLEGIRQSATMFVAVAPAQTQLVTWGIDHRGAALAGITDAVTVANGMNIVVLRRNGTLTIPHKPLGELLPQYSDFVAVAASDYHHGMALRATGQVLAWGMNVPAGLNDVVAIQIKGNYYYALRANGTLVSWNTNSTLAADLTDIVDLGGNFALKADGTVVSVFTGEPYPPPAGLNGCIAVDSEQQGLAVKSDGSVLAWGENGKGEAVVPAGLSGVVDVAAGYGFSLARKLDGTVVGWGSDFPGHSQPPSHLTRVFHLATNFGYAPIALRDAASDTAPGFAHPPASLTRTEHEEARFTAVPTGAGPFFYQWQKEGVNLPGQTEATFAIARVTPADAGEYRVVITNHVGWTRSAAAFLTVRAIPAIQHQSPRRHLLQSGDALELSVQATGTGSLSYQWLRNGLPIPNATMNHLALSSVTRADAGWYALVITDQVGTRYSAPMFVTVSPTRTRIVHWNNGFAYPAPMEGITDAIAIAAGDGVVGVLRADGSVVGTSHHTFIDPSPLPHVALAASNYLVALRADGTVAERSSVPFVPGRLPDGLADVAAIAAGYDRIYAVRTDGTVVGWSNTYSYPSYVYREFALDHLRNVVAVAAHDHHALFLKRDGTVESFSTEASIPVPSDLGPVAAIDAGEYNHTVLLQDGTIRSWSIYPPYDELALPAGLSDVAEVDANYLLGLARKRDGTIAVWDTLAPWAPANLTGVIDIAAGSGFGMALQDISHLPYPQIVQQPSQVVVAKSGVAIFNVIATGTGPFTYQWRRNGVNLTDNSDATGAQTATLTVDAPGWANVEGLYDVLVTNAVGTTASQPARLVQMRAAKVAAGRAHSLWLSSSGELYASGANASGQLGLGSPLPSVSRPHQVILPDSLIVDVAAGTEHTLILDESGALWGSGLNNNGQLGLGSTVSTTAPREIAIGVAGMAAGQMHSAFLKRDGSLWTMGSSASGQLGNGTMSYSTAPVQVADGVLQVAAGAHQTVFLKNDLTLWGMGNLNNGIVAAAPVLLATNVIHVTAGSDHLLFIKQNGTLWAMGKNNFGQLGTGNLIDAITPVQVASNVRTAIAGYYHSFYLDQTGALHGFGRNDSGQLATKDLLQRLSPTIVAYDIATVAAGEAHSLWVGPQSGRSAGLNSSGQLGLEAISGTSQGVEIASGGLEPPLVPLHTSARGLTSTSVRITWDPVAAPGYEIWRSTTNNRSNATRIASFVAQPAFVDHTVEAEMFYYYWIKAVHIFDPSWSEATPASIHVVPVTFTTQPSSQVISGADPVTLTVAAAGTPLFSYRWQWGIDGLWQDIHDAEEWRGTLTPALRIAGWATGALHGTQFRCIASNAGGVAHSNPATLAMRYAVPGVGDFNRDSRTDLLWRNRITGQVAVWFMDGSLFAGSASLGTISLDWQGAGSGDFDGNGHTDLLWRNALTGEVSAWLMNQATFAGSIALGYVSLNWQSLGTGDFNQDGLVDLLWRNLRTGEVAVWIMDGAVFAGSASLGGVSLEWQSAGIGDFNRDGHPDLLWRNRTTGEVAAWFMDRTLFAGSASLGEVSLGWGSAGTGDFNRDGHTDLLWRNWETGEVAVWFMDRSAFAGSASLGIVSPDWEF